MIPYGAKEIIALRRQGLRPIGYVFLSDARHLIERQTKAGFACCRLPWDADWADLDMRFVHGLDVAVAHREQEVEKLASLGRVLMAAEPRSLWFKNMRFKDDFSYIVEPPCKS